MSDSLEAIYSQLPRLWCKGKCQESCGPVAMSDAERKRIAALRPDVEWHHYGAELPNVPVSSDAELTCPLLCEGRCSVYEARPVTCRLWGSVRRMRCPHGCVPAFWLSDAKAYSLLDRARLVEPGPGGDVVE